MGRTSRSATPVGADNFFLFGMTHPGSRRATGRLQPLAGLQHQPGRPPGTQRDRRRGIQFPRAGALPAGPRLADLRRRPLPCCWGTSSRTRRHNGESIALWERSGGVDPGSHSQRGPTWGISPATARSRSTPSGSGASVPSRCGPGFHPERRYARPSRICNMGVRRNRPTVSRTANRSTHRSADTSAKRNPHYARFERKRLAVGVDFDRRTGQVLLAQQPAGQRGFRSRAWISRFNGRAPYTEVIPVMGQLLAGPVGKSQHDAAFRQSLAEVLPTGCRRSATGLPQSADGR